MKNYNQPVYPPPRPSSPLSEFPPSSPAPVEITKFLLLEERTMKSLEGHRRPYEEECSFNTYAVCRDTLRERINGRRPRMYYPVERKYFSPGGEAAVHEFIDFLTGVSFPARLSMAIEKAELLVKARDPGFEFIGPNWATCFPSTTLAISHSFLDTWIKNVTRRPTERFF